MVSNITPVMSTLTIIGLIDIVMTVSAARMVLPRLDVMVSS